jgi:hypothetical protein
MMEEYKIKRSTIGDLLEEQNPGHKVVTLSPEESLKVDNALYEAMRKFDREARRRQALSALDAKNLYLD